MFDYQSEQGGQIFALKTFSGNLAIYIAVLRGLCHF